MDFSEVADVVEPGATELAQGPGETLVDQRGLLSVRIVAACSWWTCQ
ncbi:hypothetical protein MXD59_01790 [Frankia sp. Ag45/Mut15]|uniref:Uncharacterized protein n=1 Tax=Frankia umida TaxID=573489 RepID=A0ABT0JSK1_9ACTN|nr:hypothetical protein [Frankia umida]MCK9874523.1 hypothetical protein [Frankia umida]